MIFSKLYNFSVQLNMENLEALHMNLVFKGLYIFLLILTFASFLDLDSPI